jgi:hypothetical protein
MEVHGSDCCVGRNAYGRLSVKRSLMRPRERDTATRRKETNMETTINCDRCKIKVTMHADGTLCCDCDSLDHRPLGETPEHWTIDEKWWTVWSESENPAEEVVLL